MLIFEGLLVGLLGSLHCAGMCGPLVLAIPIGRRPLLFRITGGLLYNIGRAVTYAGLGAIVGILGEGIRFSGLQRWVSITIGILMITSIIIPGVLRITPVLQNATVKFLTPLKKQLSRYFKNDRLYPLFLIGLLNGLLPCGLVYIALSGAIIGSGILNSILYMFVFGLGTLPMMFALIIFSNLIKSRIIKNLRRVIPVFIILLGILFILRGMNLGIPYVSPNLGKGGTHMKMHGH